MQQLLDIFDYERWRTLYLESGTGLFTPGQRTRLHLLMIISAVVLLLAAASAFALLFRKLSRRGRLLARLGLLPFALCFLGFMDSLVIEPNWLDVVHREIHTARLPAGKHLRIALVSDTHATGDTRVMRELPGAIDAEKPDLLIFDGDAINSADGVAAFKRTFLAAHASMGKFAALGNHDVVEGIPPDLMRDSGLTELDRTPVSLLDGKAALCGAPFDRPGDVLACLDEVHGYRIAVYHSPDITEEALARSADLVLLGHTHGGQFRLPFYGALITMTAFDKRYEAGLYKTNGASVYVNRGIGEAAQYPPVRLFCRPELTILDVIGTGPATVPETRLVRRNPETNLPYMPE